MILLLFVNMARDAWSTENNKVCIILAIFQEGYEEDKFDF